jgi:anaerobic magnesium-protoporphyrin IX monomethyl ester cyclase
MDRAAALEKNGLREMVAEGVPEKQWLKAMGQEVIHPKSLRGKKAKSKRVLLLSPPFKNPQSERYRLGEALGIRYLASFLEVNGHGVDVLEPSLSQLSIKDTAKAILKEDYDLVGFTVPYGGLFPNVVNVIKIIRDAGFKSHITNGGHFSTFEHIDILRYNKNIDSVVRHEGEVTLLALVNNLDDQNNFKTIPGLSYREGEKSHVNPPRPLIENLDELPFPKRDDYSRYNEGDHYAMVTSRGCYGNCSFCSVRAFYGYDNASLRFRSPDNVVDEIEYLVDNYGAKVISFLDDNFMGGKIGKKRAKEIANAIINRGLDIFFEISCRSDDIDEHILSEMKKAGLRHVSVGIESGNDEVLKRFNKKVTVSDNIAAIKILRKNNLSFTPYFIMFDPWTTLDELKCNLLFLYDNKICTYRTVKNAITIYKGTPFFAQLKNELRRRIWEYQYEFKDNKIAKIYYTVESLKELAEIDAILDILIYSRDVEIGDFEENIGTAYEEISVLTNQFVYESMLEIIDAVINGSSDDFPLVQIKTLRDKIQGFVEDIKNNLFAKGLNWMLEDLKDIQSFPKRVQERSVLKI